MVPVYQAPSLPEAELFRQRLAHQGIESVIRNVHLQGALGELPANLLPEVCVVNDSDYEAARTEVAQMESAQATTEQKQCGVCGEQSPGNFELCWSCRREL